MASRTATATATVFVLDERNVVGQAHEELSRRIVAHRLIQLTSAGRKGDNAAVVVLGTAETSNHLAVSSPGSYANITAIGGGGSECMGNPNADLIRSVVRFDLRRCDSGDVIDALVAAMDILSRYCGTKKISKHMLVCMSALGDRINPADSDTLIEAAKRMELNLQIIGCDFPDPATGSRSTNLLDDRAYNAAFLRYFAQNIPSPTAKPGSLNTVMDPVSMLESLERPRLRSVAPVPVFRGAITFGCQPNGLAIQIRMYTKTCKWTPTPAKKFSAHAESIPKDQITQAHTYGQTETTSVYRQILPNSDGQDLSDDDLAGPIVPDEHVVKAYRYGKTHIVFSNENTEAIRLNTVKSMKILGFVVSTAIPRHYFMSAAYAIVPEPNYPASKRLFDSLVTALDKNGVYAIVRYCRLDKDAPKMGAIIPMPKGYALFVKIPYSNDLRQYSFPRFEYLAQEIRDGQTDAVNGATSRHPSMLSASSMQTSGSGSSSSSSSSLSYIPENDPRNTRIGSRQDAMNIMDDLIDVMDISGTKSGIPPFNCKHVFHLTENRLTQAIVHRLTFPERRDLPVFNSRVMESNWPKRGVVERARPVVERIRRAFKITKVRLAEDDDDDEEDGEDGNETARRSGTRAPTQTEVSTSSIPASTTTSSTRVTNTAQSPTRRGRNLTTSATRSPRISQRVVNVIGTVDPVREFRAMLDRSDTDMTDSAIEQMDKVIRKLITESTNESFYPKALDAIKELRYACIRRSKGDMFNTVLRNLRIDLHTPSTSTSSSPQRDRHLGYHYGFWDTCIVHAGITLIASDEDPFCMVERDDAVKFLQRGRDDGSGRVDMSRSVSLMHNVIDDDALID